MRSIIILFVILFLTSCSIWRPKKKLSAVDISRQQYYKMLIAKHKTMNKTEYKHFLYQQLDKKQSELFALEGMRSRRVGSLLNSEQRERELNTGDENGSFSISSMGHKLSIREIDQQMSIVESEIFDIRFLLSELD